jgi:hypothetical protein
MFVTGVGLLCFALDTDESCRDRQKSFDLPFARVIDACS